SFKLLLARSARPNSAAEARKLFSASGQTREQVVQLREFHLELAFPRAGVASEDVEDQLSAVDDAAADSLFHVAKLHGSEVVVDDHERHVARFGFDANLVNLAATDEGGGIKGVAYLEQRPGD